MTDTNLGERVGWSFGRGRGRKLEILECSIFPSVFNFGLGWILFLFPSQICPSFSALSSFYLTNLIPKSVIGACGSLMFKRSFPTWDNSFSLDKLAEFKQNIWLSEV